MPNFLSTSEPSGFQKLVNDSPLWICIGCAALILFNGRWIVQWIQSEKKSESHVPMSFWWQSLIGAVLYTFYGIHKRDSVFIVGYGMAVIPCARNLIFLYRKRREEKAPPAQSGH
jgi:lipid-A-disaccharide synthase-like uncharacterized protein